MLIDIKDTCYDRKTRTILNQGNLYDVDDEVAAELVKSSKASPHVLNLAPRIEEAKKRAESKQKPNIETAELKPAENATIKAKK